MKEIVEAVFVDRDGTIGGNGHFIHPRNFELFPNAQIAIDLLKENNIKVFAFTNQYRIEINGEKRSRIILRVIS